MTIKRCSKCGVVKAFPMLFTKKGSYCLQCQREYNARVRPMLTGLGK